MSGRTYTIGLPVSVTVNDDGSLLVEVHLEDMGVSILDCVDLSDDDRPVEIIEAEIRNDSAIAEAAFYSNRITVKRG